MTESFERMVALGKGIWRYRWGVLLTAWASAVVGWAALYGVPDSYQASAIVHVDARPLAGVESLLPRRNLEQQLALIAKTLLARPNLEKVARAADLDLPVRSAREQEALIDRLAARVQLESIGREHLYQLTYRDHDPQRAKQIVSELVAAFRESGLRGPAAELRDSLRFLEQRIAEHQEKLLNAEGALKDFKRANFDAMPEHGRDFYTRLIEVGDKLRLARIELSEANSARDAIQAQLSGEIPLLWEEPVQHALPDSALTERMEILQQNLDSLRLKYTEQHPDVVAQKRLLQEVQAQADATTQAQSARSHPANPVLPPLKAALTDAQARVAALQARVAEYTRYFSELKKQLDRVPGVEADLKQLTRDYEVIKANYERLLAQREKIALEQAQSAHALEVRLIEAPRVPSSPAQPNRLLWVTLILLIALAAGVLYGVAMSELRPVFLDRRALARQHDRPTLGTISFLSHLCRLALRRSSPIRRQWRRCLCATACLPASTGTPAQRYRRNASDLGWQLRPSANWN